MKGEQYFQAICFSLRFFFPCSAPCRPVILMYTKQILYLFTWASVRQFASLFLFLDYLDACNRGTADDDVAQRLCLVQLCPYRLEDAPGKLICKNWITLVKIEEPGCWKWMHRWCFGGCVVTALLPFLSTEGSPEHLTTALAFLQWLSHFLTFW